MKGDSESDWFLGSEGDCEERKREKWEERTRSEREKEVERDVNHDKSPV